MELTNEFVIDRGVDDTWKILNDLEFIAPCMPGAQLQEIEGDEYRGIVKVKVGPITAQYKGKASFVERDAAAKVARLKAEGRDPRQGNANAMITASMEPVGDSQTSVKIHTDLGLSGKIASFGRGAIEDVSKKILGQFIENLRQKLEAEGGPSAAPAETPEAEAAPVEPKAAAPGGAPAAAPTERPTVRKIEAPEAEPVDLLAVSGGTVAKRVLSAVGVAALVIAFLYWLLGRG
ncbi:MAG: SRPBCC family protein [Acidimicrobiia bacterium]|nr:SRPBCC family protein [Acidimicrobiia bacterium]MDH4363139.1 SRPBCC family protein [Acidimicrobiia bacterium]MDH5290755.1 SRPBCC family protein [Acidimicrobiia bacterium]